MHPTGPQISTMRILWGALLASVLMYPAILVGEGKTEPFGHGPEPVMVMTITAVSVVVAVMSLLLPRMLFRNGARMQAAKLLAPARQAPEPGSFNFPYGPSAPTGPAFNDPTEAERVAMRLYSTRLILELALSEAVANFGFLLGFLGLGLARAAPFFAAAFVLQAVRFPTRARTLAAFEEAVGARFPSG